MIPPSENNLVRVNPRIQRDAGCQLCRLHSTCKTVCIVGDGPLGAPMIVGEAPGATEDEGGEAFIGLSGKLLTDIMEEVGLDRESMVVSNAVKCRPVDNRTPTKSEIRKCKPWLDYEIDQNKPKVVLLLGGTPLMSVLGLSGIKKLRGQPVLKDGVTYLPTLHPAYVLRDDRFRMLLKADLKKFKALIDGDGAIEVTGLDYRIVRSRIDVEDMMDDIERAHGFAYDLETTSLSPWHGCVVSLGIATDKHQWIVLINHPKESLPAKSVESIIERIDAMDKPKAGWNAKFDALWMLEHFGVRWHVDFDGMLAHYLLDENTLHGLDIVANERYGALEWDVPLTLKHGTSGTVEKHCEYLATDVFYTHKLWFDLMDELDDEPAVRRVFDDLLMPAARMFVDIEHRGVFIDQARFTQAEVNLRHTVAQVEIELNKSFPGVNWGSPQQISKVLFDTLGLTPLDMTAKGAPSTSESVLKRLASQHPVPALLMKRRAASQQLSFFIEGWKPFLTRSRLHPSFKLCLRKGTQVMVPGGNKNIEDIRPGDLVYSFDDNKKLTLNKVSSSGFTGMKKIKRLHWAVKGGMKGHLDATDNHPIRLINGDYQSAGVFRGADGIKSSVLRHGERVMAVHRITHNRNFLVITGYEKKQREARIVFESVNGWVPEHVHHKNEDTLNDHPNNLQGMTASKHRSLHAYNLSCRGDVRYTKQQIQQLFNSHHTFRKVDLILGCSYPTLRRWVDRWGVVYDESKAHEQSLKLSFEQATKAFNETGTIGGASRLLNVHYRTVQKVLERNNHRIYKVEDLSGVHPVYDITVENTHNFIANEICVHNSGTVTGRLSCNSPNLQQIPRDPAIRQLITAPPGWVLVEADLSQIELRIAAELSGDVELIHCFTSGIDVHWRTMCSTIKKTTSIETRELVVKTASLYCLRQGIPANERSAITLSAVWNFGEGRKDINCLIDATRKASVNGPLGLQELREVLQQNGAGSKILPQSGVEQRFINQMVSDPISEGLLRSLWEYGKLGPTPQEFRPDKLDIMEFANAMSLVSSLPPREATEIDKRWSEQRKKAKAVGFGYLFGMWWKRFIDYARDSYDTIVTEKEAQESRITFFELYKGLPAWHKKQKQFANRNGYVRSMFGRKRRLPAAMSDADPMKKQEAERQSINSPVQSFASDLNLAAALELTERHSPRYFRIVGAVHDAVLVEVRKDKVKLVVDDILATMSHPALLDKFEIKLRVPVEAEAKIGPWSLGVSPEKYYKEHGL